jgi:hypothetical protein
VQNVCHSTSFELDDCDDCAAEEDELLLELENPVTSCHNELDEPTDCIAPDDDDDLPDDDGATYADDELFPFGAGS